MSGFGKGDRHTEETKKKMSEIKKGHKPTFVGKALDADEFIKCYNLWSNGKLKVYEFARHMGVGKSVIQKRLDKLISTGVLEGGMWTDKKPIYADIRNRKPYTLRRPVIGRKPFE